MWGFGDRYYWVRKERFEKVEGIVVVFAWTSIQEIHLKSYVQIYESLGWNSLVCHSQFLNMFLTEKTTSLAFEILNVLVEELKIKPCPVVFASLSGGSKACMYRVLQIIEEKCEAPENLDDYQLARDCISGYIYDSSPVDFTSDLGTRFVFHPPRLASWISHSISSGLDILFLNRLEPQRAKYWEILYSSVSMQVPYLILCSEDDHLAPYQIIFNFAQRLQDLGGDVKLIKWKDSPHLGHYRFFPVDYKATVTELLSKAVTVYTQRIRRLEGERMGIEGTHNDISEPLSENLRKPEISSSSFQGYALETSDNFYLPSSMESIDGRDMGSVQDERKEGLIHLSGPPSINAHGVLGQILFDVCVPKNVEDWDIRTSSTSNRRMYRRHGSFNPMKCIRRSRL